MKVVGFDHVVVNSADIERSLAWYCDKLGLEPERVDEWRRGQVFFPSVRVNAETIIDLFPVAPSRFPDARKDDGLFGAQGFATSVYVKDPDGNTVELRSYA